MSSSSSSVSYTVANVEDIDAVVPDPENQLRTLTSLAKRPHVNIAFQDLTYSVGNSGSTNGAILKNICGRFRCGELSAIIGPSGAGKSSLMNILTGYISAGVTGTVTTNGRPRDLKRFHKLSSYIMQDDMLQPQLTVLEAMNMAAKLKVGDELTDKDKATVVEEILSTLGLSSARNTRTEGLSGGQRKRLSVALELVNNPPIIFLDEPTTGLDIVSIKRLVNVLQILVRQGRTIICTIHQPSATLFETFDHLYVLAKGQCVYQGISSMVVPFMSSVGLDCPVSYNPADFIIESVNNMEHITLMVNAIHNGKITKTLNEPITLDEPDDLLFESIFNAGKSGSETMEFSTSAWTQFSILLRRMSLQIYRNKQSLWIQILHHILSGMLVGGIFIGIGNDATKTINNFNFCISCLVFYMYTHVMIKVLLFPSEVRMLKREYFNRWYGLKAYYMALTLSSLPNLVILGTIFALITYLLSNQPLDLRTFGWFYVVCLLIGICSEGFGLAVGSMFSIMNGSIVGPAAVAPLLALSIYGMGYGRSVEPSMEVLMSMSYLRYGIVGLTTNFYTNRKHLDCDTTIHIYCHYRDPKIFLRDLGMENYSQSNQLYGLIGFTLFYRIIAFIALRNRLTAGFSNRVFKYVSKILRHK